jgi:hypothetical protein
MGSLFQLSGHSLSGTHTMEQLYRFSSAVSVLLAKIVGV